MICDLLLFDGGLGDGLFLKLLEEGLASSLLPGILGPKGAERTVLGDVRGNAVARCTSCWWPVCSLLILYPCGRLLLENLLLVGLLVPDTICPGDEAALLDACRACSSVFLCAS